MKEWLVLRWRKLWGPSTSISSFNSEYFNSQVNIAFLDFKMWSICLTTALSWFNGETVSSTTVLSLASIGVWKDVFQLQTTVFFDYRMSSWQQAMMTTILYLRIIYIRYVTIFFLRKARKDTPVGLYNL